MSSNPGYPQDPNQQRSSNDEGQGASVFTVILTLMVLASFCGVVFLGIKFYMGSSTATAETAAQAKQNAAEAKTAVETLRKAAETAESREKQLIITVSELKRALEATEQKANQALTAANAVAATNPNKEAAHADPPPPPADEPAAAAPAADDPRRPCALEDFDEAALHETPARLRRLRPCGRPAANQ